MENDTRPSIMAAKSPFDEPDADIVLRTSDQVDFRVFRRILALSSPFFQGMFTLPQPPDLPAHANGNGSNVNGIKSPTVDVPEDSQTLDTLLRFLYPNTRIQPFESPVHACKVAIAASKYNMSATLDRVADKVQAQYVESHPLETYFLAWRMGWEDVAKAAVRYCLDPELVKSDDDALVRDGMLDYPDAGIAYYRLEVYRHACLQALENGLDNLYLHPFDGEVSCETCRSNQKYHDGISNHCVRYWMSQYLANIKQAVLKRFRRDTLSRDELVPSSCCSRCDIEFASLIVELPQQVSSAIEDAFSETKLRFGS